MLYYTGYATLYNALAYPTQQHNAVPYYMIYLCGTIMHRNILCCA
jgi:hypothetical protein